MQQIGAASAPAGARLLIGDGCLPLHLLIVVAEKLRRLFLGGVGVIRTAACAAVGTTAMVSTVWDLRMINAAAASSLSRTAGDYKARSKGRVSS